MPCPIVYGAIVDSACLMWDSVCGKQGACRLYDTKMFRIFFHGTVNNQISLLRSFYLRIVGAYKFSMFWGEKNTESYKKNKIYVNISAEISILHPAKALRSASIAVVT